MTTSTTTAAPEHADDSAAPGAGTPDSAAPDSAAPDPTPDTAEGEDAEDTAAPVRRSGRRFTPAQRVVIALASIAPTVILTAVSARLLGLIPTGTMRSIALAAGENPGTITFGAMFLASPVQRWTGRSQIRVRKYLGIVFFLLAASNGAMFAVERGTAGLVGASVSRPFLVAGTVALLAAVPLFATSSRRAQRTMGMRSWRLLHRATYGIAAALMAHVLLIGDIGLGFVLIALGFVARIPAVSRRLDRRHRPLHAGRLRRPIRSTGR